MKLLLLFLGVLGLVGLPLLVLSTPLALADSGRTSPEATQHALDELANAIAQGKITLTPTPSLTSIPSPTPAPTATETPVPTSTSEPSATPLPALPVLDAAGGPLAGYVRPSTLLAPDVLELALPQGRWDIRLAPDNCQDLIGTWTDVLLVGSDRGPALVDRAYFTDQSQWGPCVIAQAAWHADAPCASADDGTCEANVDPVLIVALGDPELTPAPTVASTPAPAPRQAAAAAPIREVVVQTVVVFVTTEPTDTPIPTSTRAAVPATATASWTPTRTPVPGGTATVVPVVRATPSVPTTTDAISRVRALVSDANRLWLFGLVFGAAAAVAAWFWLTRGKRRYVL